MHGTSGQGSEADGHLFLIGVACKPHIIVQVLCQLINIMSLKLVRAGLDAPTSTLGAPSSCGPALSENRLLTYDSFPDLFPSCEDVKPAFESRKSSPRSFYTLLGYESCVKTSTIPRFFPSRLSCQFLIAVSSPSNAAKRLTQNMLAPS